jgi:ubiquitin carboxyl-terminal hydrolase 10
VPEVDKNGTKSTQDRKLDKVKEITENGSPIFDTPIVSAPADEAVTSLNKKASQNMPLLPHGLRNTGNICFLNATLQALLSCSPFVHLLQDLRNRSIPKVPPKQFSLMRYWCLFDFLCSDQPFHFRLATQL